MGLLERKSFARGWCPDADSVNGPADGLLRMDNLTRDEHGVLALRAGSTKINAVALADTDCHSLYTAVLSGTRYRMTGAAAAVYANGTSIASGLAGSNDIAFSTYLGQIVFARSTSKKKYDGTTVRNWGISMTGGTPTVAAVTADKKVFAVCDSTETTWTIDADDGTGVAFASGYDNTANAAVALQPSTTNGLGLIRRTLAADTTYAVLDGGSTATDDSIIAVWFYATNPAGVKRITMEIAINSSTGSIFTTDRYVYEWLNAAFGEYQLTPDGQRPPNVIDLNMDPGGSGAANGWIRLTVRRGDLIKPAANTAGKDWTTVRAVRLGVLCVGGGSTNLVKFQDMRISGGSAGAITGVDKRWKYVYVRNAGPYYGKSAPSEASAVATLEAQGATITAPSDGSRDSQINEIWLYRFIDAAGDYYRVKQETGVSGTGSVAISDNGVTDADALTINIKIEGVTGTPTTPPDNIIGIDGPWFDRTFTLTSDGLVYPSRQLNLDSFSSDQAIRVTGVDETPYWIKKAIGGLYIGTSKDVYVLDGDGSEFPDGSVNFTLRALNIDNPPIMQGAVAQEGNHLVYLANDGWRAMEGAGTSSLAFETSLLYRGRTRHGVSPVNLTTGRLRAAIVKGRLTAITPEGASTTSSSTLYRLVIQERAWERYTSSTNWRAIHREPDGTLIASDSAGFVWTLDTGTQDGTNDLAVVCWTKVDDNGQPYNRKDPWDARVRLDTAGATATIAVHLDGSSVAAISPTASSSGEAVVPLDIYTIAVFRQMQWRITGSFSTFKLYDFAVTYRERPMLQTYAMPKPPTPSLARRRFGGIRIVADTINAAATITPILDGTALTPISYTTNDALADSLTFDAVVGRDLWASVAKTTGFELYELEPIILETLPGVFKGTTPRNAFGTASIKTLSGVQVRLCTLGEAVTVTPYLDGVAQDGVSVTSDADDPTDLTIQFDAAVEATELSLNFSGNVELYSWYPLVTTTRSLGVKAWDSGPIDMGNRDLVWLREVRLFARLSDQVTITPYFDGQAFDPVTTTDAATDVETIIPIPVGREYVGKQPRLVVTSDGAFYPRKVEFTYRNSGRGTQKPFIFKPMTVAVPA